MTFPLGCEYRHARLREFKGTKAVIWVNLFKTNIDSAHTLNMLIRINCDTWQDVHQNMLVIIPMA